MIIRMRIKQCKNGYSLAEILFGLWLFSAVFIMLTGIFLNNYMVSSYAPNIVKGTYVAQNRILALKSITYDVLRQRLETSPPPDTPPNPFIYRVPSETVNYTVSEKINRRNPDNTSEEYDILDLEVTVEWTDVTQIDITKTGSSIHKSDVIHRVKLESAISPVGQY